MEPAMALCAGVATITLTAGVIGSLPAAARRLAAVHVQLPARPVAVLLLTTSLAVLVARPRVADATVPPPIVRLSEDAHAADGVTATPPAAEPISPVAATQGGAAPPARSFEAEPRGRIYVVQTGDTLWRIAERTLARRGSGTVTSADIAQFWPLIYEANRTLVGDDPNLILPGQALEIPEA